MNPYRLLYQSTPSPNEIPEYFEPGFLFNEPAHVNQQTNGCFHVLSAVNTITGKAEARCYFAVQSDKALSPIAAPFGSIEFSNALPDSVLNRFVKDLIQTVLETGVHTLRLINYPHCYAPEQADRLTQLLTDQGFQIQTNHDTFYLPITNEPFETRFTPSERRRLRKCQQANFRFTQWHNPDIWVVSAFLTDVYRHRGYRFPLMPSQLADLLQRFPDMFSVFAVTDADCIGALTVTVRVRSDILYTFLPATHPNYTAFSPMVMLTDGLIHYCRHNRIRLLDLGVSLDRNQQGKPSLIRFKENLGAQRSPKLVFERPL